MVKKHISFYERKKEIITKTWILHEKKSSNYGKVLVLNFLEMENMVFVWFKNLMSDDIFFSMEYHVFWIWKKFLFWLFRRWKIRSYFDSKSWRKMVFSSAWITLFSEYGIVTVLNFSEMGNTVFFWFKMLM